MMDNKPYIRDKMCNTYIPTMAALLVDKIQILTIGANFRKKIAYNPK